MSQEQPNSDYITTLAIQMVKNSPLSLELNDEQCEVLAGIITIQGLKAGDRLIDEGAVDESLHVVVDGHLAVMRSAAGGEPITLHVLKPGDMAGELGFIDGQAHSASLQALVNTDVFSISRTDFETLLYTQPDLVYKVMRAIMRTVHGILRGMNAQYVEMSNYISKQHGRY